MEFLIYIVTGIIAGTLAGMLGVGGGLIIVPILFFVFAKQGFDASQLMHIALATSLATIIITSLSSIYAHQKRQAIDWLIVKKLTPSILIGSFLVGYFAIFINTQLLKTIFAIFVLLAAYKMIVSAKDTAHRTLVSAIYSVAGFIIGAISALVGIGGGTLTVPFLHYTGFSFPRAIATSSACGLPIAIAGTLGFIVSGWQSIDGAFIGFVYLPAWLGIIISSILFAPLGAKLAHTLDVAILKKIFALLLILVAFKMFLTGVSF